MSIHFGSARMLTITLFFAISSTSSLLWADNHEAAQPTFVMEGFGCNYRDGKDEDDLNSIRDAYVKAADKAGIRKPRSVVWNSFKGGPGVDFVWINFHPDLATFASHTQDMARSDMAGVVDRFDAMAECDSSVSSARVLFNGGQPAVTNPPGIIESYGCFFTHGRGADDLPDLARHIAAAQADLPNTESLVIVGTDPITRGPGTPDRFIFGVHEDMETWAARTATVQGTETGQRLLRHFSSVFNQCYSAMWTTQVMVDGDDQQ